MPSSGGGGGIQGGGGSKESVMKNYNNYLQMNAKQQQAQAKSNAHAMNILRNVRSLTPDNQ